MDASAMVSAAVNHVLGGKLRGRKRTDCPRCVQGFERPELLLNYSNVKNPELRECCSLLQHACPLSTLVGAHAGEERRADAFDQPRCAQADCPRRRRGAEARADEVRHRSAGNADCAPSEKAGGSRQQHKVRLYELGGAGNLKSVGQHNDVFMGLRRPDAAVGGAEGEEGNEALDPEDEGNDLAAVAEEEGDDMYM